MQHHNRGLLLSSDDEFSEFILAACVLRPGTPKALLWRQMFVVIFSPYFHVLFFVKRLSLTLNNGQNVFGILSVTLWALALNASLRFGCVLPLFIAAVFPLTIIFQVSVVIRTLCEHVVPTKTILEKRPKDFASHATRAVFAGVPPPICKSGNWKSAVHWAIWWIDMLTIQLPFRLIILVGDAPCHDLHHRKPGSRDWMNYIVARRRESDARSAAGLPLYSEIWGLHATIDSCLQSISECDTL